MRTFRTLALAAAAAAGIIAFSPAAAQAAPGMTCHHVHQTGGNNYGILNGTQVYLPVDLGLNVTHNALGILGLAGVSDSSHHSTAVTCN